MYQVFISGYRLAEVSHGKPYYVYTVEVVESANNIRHFVEKRYSEFNALHRTLKKECETAAAFPPKRVRNTQPKVLEQRRAALELYVQKMLRLSSTKQQVLNFLGIEGPASSRTTYKRNYKEPAIRDSRQNRPGSVSHYPILTFHCDPYVRPNPSAGLPDIIIEGALLGVYDS
ncbi:sorting nexin-24 isoform X2 [Cephus cinctus]|uniref:Sorting nexin-24 isoform X2 n=1 Tax=Cephus cinctus TaxID=211228 RepID=A0AAJ7BUI1_CEPCN|nr:sorting nexin-24 isoform X2 [Cephus cinctus]